MERTPSVASEIPSRRLLAVSRALVAVVCLVAVLPAWGRTHWGVLAATLVFVGYSLAGWVAHWEGRPGLELLGLILETIFFLVFSAFGTGTVLILPCLVYFHLVLSTMLVHRWWDTWIVAAVSAGFLAVVRTKLTAALLPVVVWLGLLAAVASMYRSRADRLITECNRQAAEYREQTERARNDERHQLSSDFHDGPLQAYSSLQMRLEVLRKIMERKPDMAAEELLSIQELARAQTAEMRAFLRGIRPAEVGEAGLVSSLHQAVSDFRKHSGITATFQSQGSPDAGSNERSLELVQIVREALNNIQKHSKATSVAVSIRGGENEVEVSIADNGVGFPFSGTYSLDELDLLGQGPFSIQRRVRSLGGKLTVESRPQRGSSLSVQIST